MTVLASANEPTTMIGLAGLLIVTVGGWVKALIDGQRHGRALGQVRDQVKNGHSTPLRADLDDFRDEVRAAFKDVRRDIGGIREELRDERRERIEGDRRADERRRRHGDPM
nr:DUF2746 domain-containing protein [Mycobacterium eburneum]